MDVTADTVPCSLNHTSSSSFDQSASAALQSSDVIFPPPVEADFVIHYRGMSFHVHKSVLCHHSDYFRHYIELLVDGQRSYSHEKRREHADIDHCYRLPDRCGEIDADSDDFRLFLCHMYFTQHHRCLPYIDVDIDVDLTAQPAPDVELDHPDFDSISQLFDSPSSSGCSEDDDDDDRNPPAVYDAVLSPSVCFNFTQLLARAENNCLLVSEFGDEFDGDVGERNWRELWHCFQLALRFGLQQLKQESALLLAPYCCRLSSRRSEWQIV